MVFQKASVVVLELCHAGRAQQRRAENIVGALVEARPSHEHSHLSLEASIGPLPFLLAFACFALTFA